LYALTNWKKFKNMKQLGLIFFVFVLATGCKKNSDEIAPIVETFLNVPYGNDAKQTMDVYLPANRSASSTPSFIFIHGGSWSFGDKNDLNPYVDSFRLRFPNYAIFNLNYRLATNSGGVTSNTFPTQENDVKAATDFIFSKLTEYKIANKFVLLGQSAGAQLALIQGYKYNNISTKAVVDFYGPTDIVDMYNNPAGPFSSPANIALIMNGTPTSNPSLYNSSSPINYVTSTSAPTIMFHGQLDNVVRVSQTTSLRDKLILNNRPQVTQIYPTEGHGWFTASLLTQDFNRIQSFLAQHVQ
jgi:acetyl esterase/lipase